MSTSNTGGSGGNSGGRSGGVNSGDGKAVVIGYIDPGRTLPQQLPAALAAISAATTIIIDMRHQPLPGTGKTAALLAAHIAVEESAATQSILPILQPTTLGGDLQPSLLRHTNVVRPHRATTSDASPTVTKVFILVNEYTPEHSVLYLLAARPHAQLVGTTSSGGNGNVTNVCVPGGLVVSFSSLGIARANGHHVQRHGLRPHVMVTPTIAGLRRGVDEVLERAVQMAQSSTAATAAAAAAAASAAAAAASGGGGGDGGGGDVGSPSLKTSVADAATANGVDASGGLLPAT
mmetsp:Transcript_36776/g.90006  ORF Transcript_36776/g.90006 Transcript_36776/m.90006 type:complete len:291 (+) Transcript_36776:148-1020(+)